MGRRSGAGGGPSAVAPASGRGAAGSVAQRRVVSVLFVDLVGFTSLAEHLDPEDVALVQDGYFDLARTAVAEQRGRIEKYVGDAVVAAFGMTTATDRDAAAAVAAGWAVLHGLADLARRLGLPGDALRARAGVTTGEVLVTVDDDRWRLTGDVVNVAARLQSVADPGSVVVSSATAFAAAPWTSSRPLGRLPVRGREAAVDAWLAAPPASRPVARVGPFPPVDPVGRSRELGALEECRTAATRRRESLLVVAPPGVGKTRLLEVFAERVAARGHAVWLARVEPGGPPGYEPVAELLRQALGVHDPVRAVAALRTWAAATDLAALPPGAVRHGLDLLGGEAPAAPRSDLVVAWTTLLDTLAPTTPVWLLEDLHHAGDDLLAFVAHARGDGARRDRLVVATTRPVRERPGSAEVTVDHVLHLGPLDDGDVRALVTRLVGADVLPADLVARVVAAAGGNPLFVEELLRSWVHGGLLVRTDDGWVVRPDARPEVPTTVRAVYLGQLDHLDQSSREVVEVGAVPGTTFPSRALPALGVAAPDQPLAALRRAGLLRGPHQHEFDRAAYTYHHGLLRDAAYDVMPRGRRATLHVSYARWLGEVERHDANRDERVGWHLAEAIRLAPSLGRDRDERLDLAEEAATWLERSALVHLDSAPDRAARALGRALDLPLPVDSPDHRRRRLLQAEARRRAGRLGDALEAFADAARLALAAGDVDVAVDAALGHEDALVASRLPRTVHGSTSIRLLSAALDLLDDDHPDATRTVGRATPSVVPSVGAARARVLAARGQARAFAGDGAVGLVDCRLAMELADAAGDPAVLARVVLARRALLAGPGDLEQRLADADVLVAAARRGDEREVELDGLRLRFVDLLESGDVTGAERSRRAAEALVADLDRPLFAWYPPMWSGMLAHMRGDLAAASAAVAELEQVGGRVHYRDVDAVAAAVRMSLCHDLDRPAGAVDLVRSFHRSDPARWSGCMAAALVLAGELEEGRRLLTTAAVAGFADVPRDMSRLYTLSLLALAASRAEVPGVGAALVGHLEPWAGHVVVLGSGAVCLGAADHYLGLARRDAGDRSGALSALRAAIARNDHVGAVTAASWSRLELAGNPDVEPGERTEALDRVAELVATRDLPGIRRRLAEVQP